MTENLRFILLLTKLKLTRMMMFRFSFFGAFFADASLFVTQILCFGAIYVQVDSIGGWTRGRMLIFIGTFSLIDALNMVIFFFGLVEIPDKIREGGLDLYITKPVNPLLRLTFENVNPGSLPLVVLSVLIILYGMKTAGLSPGPGIVLAYAGLVVLMTLLLYDMELIIRTIPFFTPSLYVVDRLEGEFIGLNIKVPGTLYKGVFKIFFYYLAPYGIMATVPAQLLSGVLSPGGLIHALGIIAAFTAIALWFWRFGLRRYKSAGS
jgi:ABC-2 type transport system permease protein